MKDLSLWKIQCENWCFYNWKYLVLGTQILYLIWRDPHLWGVIIAGLLLFHISWLGICQLVKMFGIKARIKYWHLLIGCGVVIGSISIFDPPAHALFLHGLEEFLKKLVADTRVTTGNQDGSSSTTVKTIDLLMDFVRGMIGLVIVAGSLRAWQISNQGGDNGPLVDLVIKTVALVIAIDIITFLLVGDSEPTGIQQAGGGA